MRQTTLNAVRSGSIICLHLEIVFVLTFIFLDATIWTLRGPCLRLAQRDSSGITTETTDKDVFDDRH